MSELYLMATISDRNQSRRFLAFYKEYGISVTFLTLGRGTAASEVLDELPWGPETAQVRVRLQKALWEAEELIVAAKEEEE